MRCLKIPNTVHFKVRQSIKAKRMSRPVDFSSFLVEISFTPIHCTSGEFDHVFFSLVRNQEITKIEDAVLLYEKLKKEAEIQVGREIGFS